MWVIKNKNFFVIFSGVIALAAIILISVIGLKFGIEFTGGSLSEVEYLEERPDISDIRNAILPLSFGEFLVQPTGENEIFVKTRDLSEEERSSLMYALSFDGEKSINEKSFTSIGPSVGMELKNKSIITMILVIVATILFIAYAFRKVSEPVSSWKYGLVAIVALINDILVAIGAFVIMGKIMGAEVDTLFVVALLTILGLSVNNTIVIFDRIRENLTKNSSLGFVEVVGKSINETYVRSINTAVSTVVVLLALFFFGPESTKVFSMIMAIGMFFGIYTSIFLAGPLLVLIESKQKKRN
jgi:preprotein translocase subunit SecF